MSEGSNSCGVSAQSTVDAQDGAPSPKPVLRENTREQHARELFGLPPEWEWNRMQRLGPFDGKRNGTATLIEGAVCSVVGCSKHIARNIAYGNSWKNIRKPA